MVQFDRDLRNRNILGILSTRVLREESKNTAKRVLVPVVSRMRRKLAILYVKFSASPFHLIAFRGIELVVHRCDGWLFVRLVCKPRWGSTSFVARFVLRTQKRESEWGVLCRPLMR